MTDPRIENLTSTIRRLPRHAGIIFRHYELPVAARRALFRAIRKRVARRHILLLADAPRVARQWGADGVHSRSPHRSHGIRTVAVHNQHEAALAKRLGADLIFVSAVFPTRSHPGRQAIGTVGAGQIAGTQRGKAVALGGMNAKRARVLRALGFHGWAAIDALTHSENQNLKAVPI